MTKTLFEQYDKKLIPDLPRATFPGRIIVIFTAGEARKAVEYLLKQQILGIDTETKPSFKHGHQNKVALLQVSTHDTCFLFRMRAKGVAEAMKPLLEDNNILKVGLSLTDDINSLKQVLDFTPGLFSDLQKHVTEIGVKDMSLQKLYANFFRQRISKRQQLSNWEKEILDDRQKLYAATDAWACIMLYEEFVRLKQTGDYTLIPIETTNQEI